LLLVWFFANSKGQQPIPNFKTALLGKAIVTPRMVAGWDRVIIVAADGTLWGWGDSTQGELGVRTNGTCSPRLMSGAACWKEAAIGSGIAMALRNDGTLWVWGVDRCLTPNTADPSKPVQVGSDTNWIHIVVGASHCVAQKVDGTLWTWGANNEGQLGDGSLTDSKDPIQIGAGPWRAFGAGAFHGAAIAADGTLWDWGRHASGGGTSLSQVGDETNWVAVSCGEFHTMAKKSDGSWWIWGDNASAVYDAEQQAFNADVINLELSRLLQATAATAPTKIRGTQSWVAFAGGNVHALALGNDGSLWGVGNNSQWQIGDGSRSQPKSPVQVGSSTNWVAIAASSASSAGMTGDGTVFAWGFRTDIPGRTQYRANILRMLSSFLPGLKRNVLSSPEKIYSVTTRPIAIMQFRPTVSADHDSPDPRSNSAALPISSKQ